MTRISRISFALPLGLAAWLAAGDLAAEMVYVNDFESPVGSEWSTDLRSTTPLGDRGFLGQFGSDTENNVFLTLFDLPPHDHVSLGFDLYLIQSWDGTLVENGADLWELTVPGVGKLHSRPYRTADPFPDEAEHGTLGYLWKGLPSDGVYRHHFEFPHTDDTLVVNFYAVTDRGIENESWGLDNVNVAVSTIPEPSAVVLSLVGAGAALAGRRLRFRLEIPGSHGSGDRTAPWRTNSFLLPTSRRRA